MPKASSSPVLSLSPTIQVRDLSRPLAVTMRSTKKLLGLPTMLAFRAVGPGGWGSIVSTWGNVGAHIARGAVS